MYNYPLNLYITRSKVHLPKGTNRGKEKERDEMVYNDDSLFEDMSDDEPQADIQIRSKIKDKSSRLSITSDQSSVSEFNLDIVQKNRSLLKKKKIDTRSSGKDQKNSTSHGIATGTNLANPTSFSFPSNGNVDLSR